MRFSKHIHSALQAAREWVKVSRIRAAALILFLSSGLILSLLYYPLLAQEMHYRFTRNHANDRVMLKGDPITTVTPTKLPEPQALDDKDVIHPIDEYFGIVIPKIGANSRVMINVDPTNKTEYQKKLEQGVAHAKGTSLPGQKGDMFIFAHSSTNLYVALHYNAVFYLLGKLDYGDKIYIFYNKHKFTYQVADKKIIDPSKVNYLYDDSEKEKLTLMTCWPPGSSFKRLLVFANPVQEE